MAKTSKGNRGIGGESIKLMSRAKQSRCHVRNNHGSWVPCFENHQTFYSSVGEALGCSLAFGDLDSGNKRDAATLVPMRPIIAMREAHGGTR